MTEPIRCSVCKQEAVILLELDGVEGRVPACKDHAFMVNNNHQVQGKIVAVKCKCCHTILRYEWVQYKRPGRKPAILRVDENQAQLDRFIDIRTPVQRELEKMNKKSRRTKDEKVHNGDKLRPEEGTGLQRDDNADAPGVQGQSSPQ